MAYRMYANRDDRKPFVRSDQDTAYVRMGLAAKLQI